MPGRRDTADLIAEYDGEPAVIATSHCTRCGRKLVRREGEGDYDFNRRKTCGMDCPTRRIPAPDARQQVSRKPTGIRPKGLPPVLAEIAAEHPDLAIEIYEVVTRAPNTRDGGRWY